MPGTLSREGMQAALLAEKQGTEGPPNVIEGRDGSCRPSRSAGSTRRGRSRYRPWPSSASPTATSKPYACCRHIQPAVEATFQLLNAENIAFEEIKAVEVETYKIAGRACPCAVGRFRQRAIRLSGIWSGLAARYRGIKFEAFRRKHA